LLVLRSALLWAVGWAHMGVCGLSLAVLGRLFGPRRIDHLTRVFCLNVLRLGGARYRFRRSPKVTSDRVYVFVANHVNLFDAFALHPAIPVYVRGLELESHFRIPAYGWMMKSLGTIPVPEAKTPSGLRKMWQRAGEALRAGTSLMIFPEGSRTHDGSLLPFRDGAFRIAEQAGVPVVPVTIAGSFTLHHRNTWLLKPAIVVTVHDPIEPGTDDVREKAREAIASAL
jgi:1-acyl-sn-glycerol-3-phosphate acyltransferase